MYKFYCWIARILFFSALMISLPASAYLQFTYTSQQLPLTQALYDNAPWEDFAYEDYGPFNFSISFKADEQDLSLKPVTHFLMDDFTFAFDADYFVLDYLLRISPTSNGRVSLNKNGEIVGWNFTVTITELITPDTDMAHYYAAGHRDTITSRGGAGSCNCDVFTNRVNAHTWHYVWFKLAPLQYIYSGESQFGNWTIEKINVPEPGSAGLLMAGLLGLLGLRSADKK
ncbi:MAG TPA: PEP-CTERM sorting domain-containing protein [Cellvibrio sp.]|nr:PEP-CTERM sorting domain-containing protein [Cellvibrio sp.]